jgi:hypothetical protein
MAILNRDPEKLNTQMLKSGNLVASAFTELAIDKYGNDD